MNPSFFLFCRKLFICYSCFWLPYLFLLSMSLKKNSYNLQISELSKVLNPSKDSNSLVCSSDLNQQLLKCEDNFYGCVEKNLLIFRSKILEMTQCLHDQGEEELHGDQQINLLRALRKKMNALNCDLDYLLEQGILTLYMDLNELLQSCNQKYINGTVKKLVKKMMEEFSSILRQYFIFQECHYQTTKREKSNRESTFSLRRMSWKESSSTIENSHKQLDEIQLKEIEKIINSKPLSKLFQEQMKKEERNIIETQEICRICFQNIKLLNLQRHVNNCAKKSELRQQLDINNFILQDLEESLKEKYKESCSDMVNQTIDEEFRKICKLILNPSRKIEKKIPKRNSLIGVKSENNLNLKMEVLIEDYINNYDKDSILVALLQGYRERNLIQKRLSNLQRNILFSSKQKKEAVPGSKSRSEKRSRTQVTPIVTKKKSRFITNQICSSDSHQSMRNSSQKGKTSSSSSSTSKEDKDQNEFAESNGLKKLKSKGSLSRRCLKQIQNQFDFQSGVKNYSSSPQIHTIKKQKKNTKSSISLKDFEILKFLGAGAFGKVYMVRRKETSDIYALKIIKLPENCDQKELISIKNEHQIFKNIAGDHLVKAPFSFSESNCHIFVLQFLPGGDLRNLLTQQVYFEQERAKLYVAQIILAIEHLHKFQIIHRDLKPQNLVIDRKGHLKLTDFGLSEFQMTKKLKQSKKQQQKSLKDGRNNRKRRTAIYGPNKKKMKLIGTPDYIAPQIINQTSYSNYTIDWWSLGVMTYELIIGNRPFCADTIDQVIDNITNFNIDWPEVGYEDDQISPEAKDFIQQLLNKDFVNRLGSQGADQLKQHPFMNGVVWQKIKTSDSMLLPPCVTKLSDIVYMQEDSELKKQIQSFLQPIEGKNKQFQLKAFIRFDLLKSQTIQNGEKKQQKTQKKLKRLNTLKDLSHHQTQTIQM